MNILYKPFLASRSKLLAIGHFRFSRAQTRTGFHETKDILHVMRILGHNNIKNTLVYTRLIGSSDEEYVSKAAWTLEEASRLIESGFECICDVENARLFGKRK